MDVSRIYTKAPGRMTLGSIQNELSWALRQKPFNPELVDRALRLGANLNRPLTSEAYCLYEAVWDGDAERTAWMLERGALPDQRCTVRYNERPVQINWTALLAAAVQDRADLVALLLQHGASATRLFHKHSLLHCLAEAEEVRQYFQMDGSPEAKAERYTAVLPLLIEAGAPIGTTSRDSPDNPQLPLIDSPLHRAVTRGLLGMVRILVDQGADLEASWTQGQTPLMLAIIYGERATAEYLWRAGANPHARCTDGKTPCQSVPGSPLLDADEAHYAWFRALIEGEQLQQELENPHQTDRVALAHTAKRPRL